MLDRLPESNNLRSPARTDLVLVVFIKYNLYITKFMYLFIPFLGREVDDREALTDQEAKSELPRDQ